MGRSLLTRGMARRCMSTVLVLMVALTGLAFSASASTFAAAASTSARCGSNAVPGSRTLTLTIAGHERLVIVHVPSGYKSSSPVALVLNLHGSGSTAAQQESFSGMDATADRHSFIVAYPQGLIASGTGFDWNIPDVPLAGGSYPPKGSASDVKFLVDLVSRLASMYCINRDEVYATGMSGGGRMASQLACDASNTFAAVAPVAGLRRPTPCPTTRPVPVIAFHGTADPIDPYKGHGEAYWTYSVQDAASLWASQDECSTIATTVRHKGYTLSDYSKCGAGAVVELYSLKGEGHEWPGGPTMPLAITDILGAQSQAVNADEVMWSFFAQHPLAHGH